MVPVGLGSGGAEDALAEQIDLRTAEHLPLDELEPVDLAFWLAVAAKAEK